MDKGFFGIGIQHSKIPVNIGTLWRSAYNFGASFIFTIGRRYSKDCSDTTKAWQTIPLYHYIDFDDFKDHIPYDTQLVGLEFPHDNAVELNSFAHPKRAVYLLGAEDSGLTAEAVNACHRIVYIKSKNCLNVAVAGSIVMCDRQAKGA